MKTPILSNQKSEVHHSDSKNVYENTILVSKRAKQVVLQRRVDFFAELEEFEGEETLTDVIQGTTYRERLAKKYEKMSKPIMVAIKDLEEGNIMYSYPDKKA